MLYIFQHCQMKLFLINFYSVVCSIPLSAIFCIRFSSSHFCIKDLSSSRIIWSYRRCPLNRIIHCITGITDIQKPPLMQQWTCLLHCTLENSPWKIHVLIGLKSCLHNLTEAQNLSTSYWVVVMMVGAKNDNVCIFISWQKQNVNNNIVMQAKR